MSALDKAREITRSLDGYAKVLDWHDGSVPGCINSEDAYLQICSFSEQIGWTEDRILALTHLLLSSVSCVSEPKIIADCTVDYNGNKDFQFTVEDYVRVLKKKPTSKPKRDPNYKYVPEFRTVRAIYSFGLELDAKCRLFRLRFKIYPQRSWFGYRYEEKFRDFESLLSILSRELYQYYSEDSLDISSFSSDAEDEDVPSSDEDFE